jgi:hypothetical protein
VQLTHERAWVKLAWTHSASEKEEDEVKPRENASLLAIFRGAAYLKVTKPIKDSANREENKINPFIFYPEVPRIFSNLAKDSATDAWASMSQAAWTHSTSEKEEDEVKPREKANKSRKNAMLILQQSQWMSDLNKKHSKMCTFYTY